LALDTLIERVWGEYGCRGWQTHCDLRARRTREVRRRTRQAFQFDDGPELGAENRNIRDWGIFELVNSPKYPFSGHDRDFSPFLLGFQMMGY